MKVQTLLVAGLVLVATGTFRAEATDYAGVGSLIELGMGARPLAMGNAFVGLADDANCLLYNAAGLAWQETSTLLSSVEARPGTASYGHISLTFPRLGASVHFLDFGEIPERDEYGNVIGEFSYRSYALIGAVAALAADLPFLSRWPLSTSLALGLAAKALKVSTLGPGVGAGVAFDLSVLFRATPSRWRTILNRYGIGVTLKNAIAVPMTYGSGHSEDWPRELTLGTSFEILQRFTFTADVTSERAVRIGFEWRPLRALSIWAGLRNEGLWMASFGVGVEVDSFTFDLALVPHLYLNPEYRGSFGFSW